MPRSSVSAKVLAEHGFSASAVRCFQAMGDHYFSNPLESHPWGGRPHVIAWRQIRARYLTNADAHQAYWAHEQVKRVDPDWYAKDPGMTYLRELMDERSGGRWRAEYDELRAAAPTLLEYMDREFGEEARRHLADHRRARFCLVQPHSSAPA